MKKFIILISAGLLLPAFCFGAMPEGATYQRTPSGSSITNPITFEVSGLITGYPSRSWLLKDYYGAVITQCFNTDEGIAVENLELGSYSIWYAIYSDAICEQPYEEGFTDDSFEVVEAEEEPAGGIWTIPSDFLSTTTGYIGEFFGDIWTLIALVIGLPLSFWGIKKVIGLVKVR